MSQPVPMASVMSSDSPGFASRTNRRGVMPLVTLVNLPGKNSLKSGSTLSRSSCECSSATPLTLEPATVARYAIRTERSGNSEMIDMLRMRISSSPKRSRTSTRNSSLMR